MNTRTTMRINALGVDAFDGEGLPTVDPFVTSYGMRVLCVPILNDARAVVAALAITRSGISDAVKSGTASVGGAETGVFSSRRVMPRHCHATVTSLPRHCHVVPQRLAYF